MFSCGIQSTSGDIFSFIVLILLATNSGVTLTCPSISVLGPLNWVYGACPLNWFYGAGPGNQQSYDGIGKLLSRDCF